MSANTPLGCPFCGKAPDVGPKRPELEGNAWGYVQCNNSRCPAQPSVRDGASVADDRGSGAYKSLAIRRWNRRAQQGKRTAERAEKLLAVGAQMANVMFNMAQKNGHALTAHDCELFDKLRKEWDVARATPAAEAKPEGA